MAIIIIPESEVRYLSALELEPEVEYDCLDRRTKTVLGTACRRRDFLHLRLRYMDEPLTIELANPATQYIHDRLVFRKRGLFES